MTKNAEILSEEYFISYFRLIQSSHRCSLEEAKKITIDQIFEGDLDIFGENTKKNFLLAYETLKNTSE